MKKTAYKVNNIDIIILNTNKFKNTYFNIVFSGKHDEKNICKRNILINTLIDSSKKYYTNKLLNVKLNSLYSTDLLSNYSKQYELSQTNFTVNCVNEKYLKEENFYEQIVELIYEILFNPRIENKLFNEDVFNECKDNLENKIKSVYDSKASYALIKMLENMAPNEVISKSSLGTLEELETVTLADIYDEYQRLLSEHMIIYLLGEFEEKKIINHFNNFFIETKIKEGILLCPLDFKQKNKVFIEKQEINQSRLSIGYRINEEFNLRSFFVSSIFNYIFGGSYSSVLTTKIRKENSFAYSVYSSIILQNKLMFINMGIDKINYTKIIKLINEEIFKFKKGFISNELLEIAKEMTISEVNNINDNLSSIMSSVKFKDLYGFSFEGNESIQEIKSINANDIQEFSKKIVFDTVFLLEGN